MIDELGVGQAFPEPRARATVGGHGWTPSAYSRSRSSGTSATMRPELCSAAWPPACYTAAQTACMSWDSAR
jgi:hypothetical protein